VRGARPGSRRCAHQAGTSPPPSILSAKLVVAIHGIAVSWVELDNMLPMSYEEILESCRSFWQATDEFEN